MSSITFSVIDLTCESADQSFFPPRVVMTTKSTTQIATVIGFPEYPGFESFPPKKYHTLSWEGTSEQQLWFPAGTLGNPGPTYQIAGARFDYSGSSTIDSQGNYTTLYTKNRSEMCSAADNEVQTFLQGVGGGLDAYSFKGWLGPTGHEKCPPPGTPYSFVSNDAIGKGVSALNDSSPFWGSKQPNPASNARVSDFNPLSATQGFCIDSGGDPNASTSAFIALFEPVSEGSPTPPISGDNQGTLWFFAGVVWNHDYSSTLSNEYTDAEAFANAQVVLGNGATAQNNPRTTGFVSTLTSVVYTLSMTNLIAGTSYTVSVDLWDQTSGVTTTIPTTFQAVATTNTIIAPIPTPSAGHLVQVRNPRIVFA